MENPKPINAWKLTVKDKDYCPVADHVTYVVQNDDGSGNFIASDGWRMYKPGIPFENEPKQHMDPHSWFIEACDVNDVPPPVVRKVSTKYSLK